MDDRKFIPGEIVKHFKYETISPEDQKKGLYTYTIIGYATHTESKEQLVIYKANYNGRDFGWDFGYGHIFARPYDMFISEVDHEKYPDIVQKYRFEEIKSVLEEE